MNRTVRSAVLAAAASTSLTGLVGCDLTQRTTAPVRPTEAAASTAPAPVPLAAAPTARRIGMPTRVVIPAIDVDEALYGVGVSPDGAMETPDFGDAGWYD